jgi:hypothetical protein
MQNPGYSFVSTRRAKVHQLARRISEMCKFSTLCSLADTPRFRSFVSEPDNNSLDQRFTAAQAVDHRRYRTKRSSIAPTSPVSRRSLFITLIE